MAGYDLFDLPHFATLPVLGEPDPAAPAGPLPVVGERVDFVPYYLRKLVSAERHAVIELSEGQLRGSPGWPGLASWVFIVDVTKEVAPNEEVIVSHELELYLRRYEITRDGRARWRRSTLSGSQPPGLVVSVRDILVGCRPLREGGDG